MKVNILIIMILLLSLEAKSQENGKSSRSSCEIVKTDKEWKESLTAEQYRILIQKGTERPFTGKHLKNKVAGIYLCAACGNQLFTSDTKFDSGTGWPSFWKVIASKNVSLKDDVSFGMKRVEVCCAKCDGHLGHLFDDGPKPTGLRFCINSIALNFKEKKEK